MGGLSTGRIRTGPDEWHDLERGDLVTCLVLWGDEYRRFTAEFCETCDDGDLWFKCLTDSAPVDSYFTQLQVWEIKPGLKPGDPDLFRGAFI